MRPTDSRPSPRRPQLRTRTRSRALLAAALLGSLALAPRLAPAAGVQDPTAEPSPSEPDIEDDPLLDDPDFEGPVIEVPPPSDDQDPLTDPPDDPTPDADPGPPAAGTEPGDPDQPPAAGDEGPPDDGSEARVDEAHVVRYYLERFEVVGNDATRAGTITRQMLLAEGEAFRADDPRIDESRAALLATGLFEEVRFSLRRGSQRGWVVFQIRVRERWTLVIDDIAYGYTTETGFGGLGASELNLFGTGSQLSAAFAVAADQQAYRLRFFDPTFLGSEWSLEVAALAADAQDYVGFNGVTSIWADGTEENDHATVNYLRFGGSLGSGRKITDRLRVDFAYHFEWLSAAVPVSATYLRGAPGAQIVQPVPVDLLPDDSLLAFLGTTVTYDTRDDPFLPLSGSLLRLRVDLAHPVLGSDYPYARFVFEHAVHFPLPWNHTVTLHSFLGAILGEAPLFKQFYVGDLSDLIPARYLDLNFHDYPAPNLLGTAVGEMQYEDLAARFAVEYSLPLYRARTGFLYGLDLFVSVGIFALASVQDVNLQIPGYAGGSVVPVDLTANLGLRFDTLIGRFHLSVADAMAFVPWE